MRKHFATMWVVAVGFAVIFCFLMWATSLHAQTYTYPALQTNNVFTGTNAFNGGATASTFSAGAVIDTSLTVINVLENKYGYTLKNDGITDNCAAWNSLEAAVPAGTIFYEPRGKYHFSSVSCPNGQVFTQQLALYGDGPGAWNGSTFINGTVTDAQIVTNLQPGVTVANMAVDISASTTFNTCFSSGAPATGVMNGAWINLGCNGNSTPGHGVLVQSGGPNTIRDIHAYNVYHAVGVRSPHTSVESIYGQNNTDVIVKSTSGSGSVYDVNLAGINCNSTSVNAACGVFVTSEAAGVQTFNVTVNGLTCYQSAYCGVLEADSGGVVHTVTFNNVVGTGVGNGIYSYFGDANAGNSIDDIVVNNPRFWIVSGNAFQNSSNTTHFVLNDAYAAAVSGSYMVGTFTQGQSSGWNVWTGNTNDPSLYSTSTVQGASTAGFTSEYPTGVATLNATQHSFGNTLCQGSPGEEILGSTTAAARYGETLTGAHCLGNDGTLYSYKRHVVFSVAGTESFRSVPPNDTDGASIDIGGTNHAQSLWNWSIRKNGSASLTSVTFPNGAVFSSSAGVPSGSCTVGSQYTNSAASSLLTLLYLCYPANTWNAVTIP